MTREIERAKEQPIQETNNKLEIAVIRRNSKRKIKEEILLTMASGEYSDTRLQI